MTTEREPTQQAPMRREQVLWALDSLIAEDIERSIHAWHTRRKAIEAERDRLRERLQARMDACCNQVTDSCRECAKDDAVMRETLDA